MYNIASEKKDEVSESLVRSNRMILIPASSFFMGSNKGSKAELPVHEVWLDDFWMDETLVTNRQFARFADETHYQTDAERTGAAWGYREGKYAHIENLCWRQYAVTGREEHPVVLVSWNDASAFAKWAGKQLPTEDQWEKAARGNHQGRLYPWGDQSPDGTQSNFAQSVSEFPGTKVVKSFPSNDYGLYDMVGNVWQWCADHYGPYDSSEKLLEKNPDPKDLRVRRGGAWNVIQPFRLRSSNRGAMDASAAVPNVGFRCVIKQ